MSDLLIHPQTYAELERFKSSGNHAVLLEGTIGAGLATYAQALARRILGVKHLEVNPYFSFIAPETKSITIEQVRELQKLLMLRTTGTNPIRRVIILHKVDMMTDEAQNALLKSLEEPPADTILILTSYQPQVIAPTIRSRVQSIFIRRIDLESAQKYFGEKYTTTQIHRAHALSDGQAGLMVALLEYADGHEVAAAIEMAKELYGMKMYDRLLMVEQLSKDKDALPQLLFACKRICIGALESAATKNQQPAITSWTRKLAVVIETESQLRSNPNPKLYLTNLFMQM